MITSLLRHLFKSQHTTRENGGPRSHASSSLLLRVCRQLLRFGSNFFDHQGAISTFRWVWQALVYI
jgi:hypothetical protein